MCAAAVVVSQFVGLPGQAGAAPSPVQAPGSVPAGEPSEEAVALAESRATGEPVEVEEAATPTETVTANPDGSLTVSVAPAPVRTVDESGDLVPIDTTLQDTQGDLETAATTNEVTLDGDGTVAGDGVLARVSDPESGVSVGLSYDGDLAAPTVAGATAVYEQQDEPGLTSVRVSATDSGFAAHVLLDANPIATDPTEPTEPTELTEPEDPVYRFPISVGEGSVRLVDGVLEVLDAAGNVVGFSSTLRMWDSQTDVFGDPSNIRSVDAVLDDTPSGPVLELRPDPAFLSDPSTVYPVTVDPDIQVPPLAPMMATYVTNQTPNSQYVGDWSLRVGSNDGTYQNESFVNFGTDALAGSTVTDAKLRLYQYGSGVCAARQIQARMATSEWVDGPGVIRTWAKRGTRSGEGSRYTTSASFNAGTSGGGTPDCGGSAWQSIDVTGQVSSWSGMNAKRYGIYLQTPWDQRLNTAFEKRFCSDDRNTTGAGRCQDAGLGPELRVTYVPQIGDQSWYSVSEHSLDERTTLKVNHFSGNTYLAANDVQVSSLGMNLQLGRRYNSRSENPGQFGPRWSLTGGPDVWLEKIDQWRYVYHAPDGTAFGPFVRKDDSPGSGGSSGEDYRRFFTPASGVGARLKDNATGSGTGGGSTFTLTFNASQTKYEFTQMGTAGHLYQTKQTDRSGNAITYRYVSGTRRLASVEDTAGRTYQIGYGSGTTADVITQITDTNGPTTRTWNYDYTGEDAGGLLSGYTDPEGDVTTYEWADAEQTQGKVIERIIDPVNASGQAPTTRLVTRAAETTRVTYGEDTTAGDASYSFTYQDSPVTTCTNRVSGTDRSAVVTSSEPSMGVTTYCFKDRDNGDLNHNPNNVSTTVIDGKGDKNSTSYSPDNQPEESTNDAGTTVNTYGDPGAELGDRLESTEQPDGSGNGSGVQTHYRYGNNSSIQGHDYLPSSVTDGEGNCTFYQYDGHGRLTDSWIGRAAGSNNRCDQPSDNGGFHYSAEYNSDGTLAWVADPNATANVDAQRTAYTYWAAGQPGFVPGTKGQLKSVRRPGGDCSSDTGGAGRSLCTSYTYDGLSRTLTATDGRGETTTSVYDVMDRTIESRVEGDTSCDTAAGTCISYDYDAAGNLVERVDALGITSFGYDRLNRQTSQGTPDGVEVDYGYNRDSRLANLTQTLPGIAADTVAYHYDTAGLLNAVVDAAGTINLTHDSNQRLTQTVFPTSPASSIIERGYTASGRTKSITVWSGVSVNDQMTDYTYTWTKDGKDTKHLRKIQATNSPAAVTYQGEFSYNSRGQLTGEDRSNGGGPDVSYTYDDAGNIATAQTGTGTGSTARFGYDYANQLCWTGTAAGTTPVASCPSNPPGPPVRTRSCPATRPATAKATPTVRSTTTAAARPPASTAKPRTTTTKATTCVSKPDPATWSTPNPASPPALPTTVAGAVVGRRPRSSPGCPTDDCSRCAPLHPVAALGACTTTSPTTTRPSSDSSTTTVNAPGPTATPLRPTHTGREHPGRARQPVPLARRLPTSRRPARRLHPPRRPLPQPTTGAFTQPDPQPGNMREPLRLNPTSTQPATPSTTPTRPDEVGRKR
ncbi:DNRLRE domain-containing protein [Nocardioides sambongensis]|uniref:DNRLRE domain-containing protein n=1 Tax=Nocardioides sambongensis TaxID=2589074 RepID=UPI00112D9F15|nr:DNRLRE domain-containing protein [Nocardioides sambongensis]